MAEPRPSLRSRLMDGLVVGLRRRLGLDVVRLDRRDGHGVRDERDEALRLIRLLQAYPEQAPKALGLLDKAKSQLHQDLFVLSHLGFPRQGFFVEFGATDGVHWSNTWLMEKALGWRGILAEPGTVWHDQLRRNRACAIDTAAVWHTTGQQVPFNQTDEAELSTIHSFSASDGHRARRRKGRRYEVTSISLEDLLDKHQAPQRIDYLSIDTEGSELQILQAFPWERHRFRVITCEHNHMPVRAKIFELLSSKGYRRVHEGLSMWDDWYVDAEAA